MGTHPLMSYTETISTEEGGCEEAGREGGEGTVAGESLANMV